MLWDRGVIDVQKCFGKTLSIALSIMSVGVEYGGSDILMLTVKMKELTWGLVWQPVSEPLSCLTSYVES